MRSIFWLSLLFRFAAMAAHAQSPSVNIGDPAPPLHIREWVKDVPVQEFEKGRVYVLEFWATWCRPCIAAMPHLSALANEYKEKVSIIGIDIYENKNTPVKKIKAFVDSMGQRMNYHIAIEDSNAMVNGWLEAAGEKDSGIPRTFVVNTEGKLAWMGHPAQLADVLRQVVNNTWDIEKALADRTEKKRLQELDKEANYTLMAFVPDQFRPGYPGNPDSALLTINEIVTKDPGLKYAPFIASYTFSSLLKTNLHKAYEYGKEVLVNPTYEEPAYYAIITGIDKYPVKANLPADIYELGAEAYAVMIDHFPYPELVNIPKYYDNMAMMYWHARNKAKAIDAMQKAIAALSSRENFSVKDMTAFQARLEQYRNM